MRHNNNFNEDSLKCSFTVEAAFSLTLFIFASVIMMVPLLILGYHRNASAVLEENARSAAKYKYIEYYGKKAGFLKTDEKLLSGLETGIVTASLTSKVSQKGMLHIDLITGTRIDSESVKYVLNYNAELPFSIFGLASLPQQVSAYRRAWIGADDYRWGDPADEETANKEEIVYISTKLKNVYHSTLSCTYITHDFLSAPAASLDGQPSKYGGKFAPCESCRPAKDSALVYYTEGGKRYHRTPACRAMQSYIQETTITKAKEAGRHLCIRCGKRLQSGAGE